MITQEEVTALRQHTETVCEDRVPFQTFRRSFEQISTGEEPWIPLGNFMHQFFGQYKHCREELVRDPIEVPEQVSPDLLRWAVFCTASVEYLCKTYDVPTPAWACDDRYRLEEPWYYAIGADLPQVQEKLRQTTPEAFSQRNVFCGDRTYHNKYEHDGRHGRRKTA